jgi:alanine racemase
LPMKSGYPGRPTVAEIDLKALASNYRTLRDRIPGHTHILAVVKADAYGHGALPISLELERLGAEYLGVATSDEGIQLREGKVKLPILVLGGVFSAEDMDRVLSFDLTPVLFEKEILEQFSKAATRRKQKARVHIKVDTGMTRLGVPVDSWPEFVREIKKLPGVETEGILSHFAMADEDGGVFSATQWGRFQQAVSVADELGIACKYNHIANSGNSIGCSSYCGNLVRPGLMLYGCYPGPGFRDVVRLDPVLTLKTRVHFLKSVSCGTAVSYGCTFVTNKESLIATLPIGYADGYSWRLSNVGEVLVRGTRVPVAGRVCMDYVMVDVTHVPGVAPDDEVVLIGTQGKERITAEEIAEKINSIPYEVLCSIGKRVPRVYKRG